MPLSVDEIVQIGKQKGVDMSKYEQKLRQKYGQTGVPDEAMQSFGQVSSAQQGQTATAPQTQPVSGGLTSDQNINALIEKATTPKYGVRQNIADAIGALGGHSAMYRQKTETEDPLDTQIKQLRVQNLQAGLDTDEQGNPIKRINPQQVEREERMKKFEGRRTANTLRGELNQNSYIKRFQEMNSASRGIDAMLQDTLSRQDNQSKNIGDQALITLYNKILDPMSVVRESEYARTPDGQALMNRIQGFIQKVQMGGAGLTDQDRVEIGRAAKVLINNAGDLYNSKIDEYSNLADVYEVDPAMITTGFEKFSPYEVQEQTVGQPQPTQMVGSGGQMSDEQAYQEYLKIKGVQ